MKKNEHVRWCLLSSTSEEHVHDPHWHEQTVVSHHVRADRAFLDPLAMIVADMIPGKATSTSAIWAGGPRSSTCCRER
jgi:hypothetical protein